jgi:hypothetical protein
MHDVDTGSVAVDTAAFIYFIEAHPAYLPASRSFFAAAGGVDRTGVDRYLCGGPEPRIE